MNLTPRRIATIIGIGRLGFGIGMLWRPNAIGRSWIGANGEGPAGAVAFRAIGARDAAIALGLLLALRQGRPLRGWVEAGMVADMGDATATAISFGALPMPGRAITFAIAAGSAITSLRIASKVDADEAGA